MNEAGTPSRPEEAPPPAAPARSARGVLAGWLRRLGTLRGKGMLVFVVMTLYVLTMGLNLTRERGRLMDIIEELEHVHRCESQLTQANLTIARAVLLVNDNFVAPDIQMISPTVVVELEAVRTAVDHLEERFPRVIFLRNALVPLSDQLAVAPSRGLLGVVRGTLQELITELDGVTQAEQQRRAELLAAYRQVNDRLIREGLVYSVLGITVFGLVIAAFLTRLALDIGALKARATAIVKGYRGTPLTVSRGDEIGSLMASVNSIQDELRARETQIELERQQRFHREKMAAVGSLAAAIAHEINNPITAIAGIAEVIQEQCRDTGCANHGQECQPGMILEQARRVGAITRQLATFSAPHPQGNQLTDVNGLVRSTLAFVSYDRRLRGVDLATDLDGDLPAVNLVADHLTQVLMNLLLNAADALEGHGDKRILVTTAALPDGVVLRVMDNGSGMDSATLEHAFDEYYSTKPNGKGTGLGLAVCKSLVEGMGGVIDIASQPAAGTTISIRLPLHPPQAQGAS